MTTVNVETGSETSRSSTTTVEESTKTTVETITTPAPSFLIDSGNARNKIALGGDVVAQTFKIPVSTRTDSPRQKTSIVTSVDLWFKKVDTRLSQNIVFVEIREVINGYPGTIESSLGRSMPVKLRSSNAVATPTTSNGVNFRMLAPVKIESNKEYCLIVNSPSEKTELFIANRGDTLIDGSGIHSSKSNIGGTKGSMFISENLSVWVPYLNTDLTFRVNRARFGSETSTVQLKNTIKTDGIFKGDIGVYSSGLCFETYENSYYVKVIHPNHGLHYSNATATIEGLTNTTSYNGILGSDLNKTHTVEFATLDSYFIKVGSKATASGRPPVPTFDVFSSQSIVYDSILPNIPLFKEEDDEIKMTLKTTQTNSVVLETSLDKVTNTATVPVQTVDEIDIPTNEFYEFNEPMIVRDGNNATQNDIVLNLTIQNGDDYSAPFFKTDNGGINPIVFRNIVGQSLIDSDLDSLSVTEITNSVGDSDIEQQQKFISYQSAKQSITENSCYVTKQIDLANPSDNLIVKFDADMQPSTSVEVLYKARELGDDTPFEDLEWELFPNSQQINEANYGVFGSSYERKQYTAEVDLPYDFSAFKVKLRIRTQNEADVPKLYDLRIIATI